MEVIQIISLVVIVLVAALFIAWKIYKNGLRKVAIELIVEVEDLLKDNQEKFNTVVNGILVRLPFPFNFIPVNFIEKFVQATFDEIKKALDYKKGVDK